jgi:acyl-coenzyme A synthetase/AMP-(fatty) acid ligase
MLCATAPLPLDLALAAEQRFGAPLYEIYGCTEAGQVATRRTAEGPQWRTLPDVLLRQNAAGTWAIGGHVAVATLLNDVIELADSGIESVSEGRTEGGNGGANGGASEGANQAGPAGSTESWTQGEFFELRGRTADLVNIAGKRTSLANLNFHLNAIAGVVDGVFVMPDEDESEFTRLTAFVVAPGMSSAQLNQALRQRIDAVFMPRPLYMVDTLPRNATGKLTRQAVRDLLARIAGTAR